MKWRKGDDYPDNEGKYIVRMSIGSMDRKVEVRESQLTRNGCRPHWQGAFDWNYVIEWLDESPSTETGQQGMECKHQTLLHNRCIHCGKFIDPSQPQEGQDELWDGLIDKISFWACDEEDKRARKEFRDEIEKEYLLIKK